MLNRFYVFNASADDPVSFSQCLKGTAASKL